MYARDADDRDRTAREAGVVHEAAGGGRAVDGQSLRAVGPAEQRREARVLVGDEHEDEHHDEHPEHVPPHADVVEERDQANAERVQQAVKDQHDGVDLDQDDLGGDDVERHVQEPAEDGGESEVDAGRDRDLAEHVEPSREPRPRGSVALRELRRPVVQTAGRRVARAHLAHRERDERDHEADERPPVGRVDRATDRHPEPEQGEAPRQDRDDRERDGEVREPAHPAFELLRVAELVESFDVGLRCPARAGPRAGTNIAHLRPLSLYRWVRRCVATGIRVALSKPVKPMTRRRGSDELVRARCVPGQRYGRNRYSRKASCSIGKISKRVNPASSAYLRKVSGRITVPVAADGDAARPAGRQSKMLQP